ncbi:MAG: Asp/Glu racemase [Boseongicola sp.]|nr:Asp/Glu racemase [Boseongicola sp.]
MKPSRGRARLGLLVPFTNTNLEPDMTLMSPPGISVHSARLGGYDAERIPDESQMQGLGTSDIDEPLRLLTGVRPDIILYGCTSATLAHGPDFDRKLAARSKSVSGVETVTAAGALVSALQVLGAKKVGLASPYVQAINDMAVAFLAEAGIETVQRSEVTEPLSNEDQGAMTPDEVIASGIRADHDDADAVVLSCTDMRSVESVARLERALCKPAICSNQAMMHEALRRLGIDEPVPGFGTLLERPRT